VRSGFSNFVTAYRNFKEKPLTCFYEITFFTFYRSSMKHPC
jgi:hypothetical protein